MKARIAAFWRSKHLGAWIGLLGVFIVASGLYVTGVGPSLVVVGIAGITAGLYLELRRNVKSNEGDIEA